jgi:predicted 3-demethylubiquinone-9 3-methyltransferase (glyoxalase superfamily)
MSTHHPFIIPHLWFDKEAVEAVNFYVSLFPNSRLLSSTVIPNTPSGDAAILKFQLLGADFMAINAGPMFKINPSVSFYVYCETEQDLDRLYQAFMDGGEAMIGLGSYEWSQKYAWVKDRFGMTWQLDLAPAGSMAKIVPSVLFVNKNRERLKDAVNYYVSVFPNSKIRFEAPYDPSAGFHEGTLLFAQFELNGFVMNAMSSPLKHEYDFNEAMSFIIHCDTQHEIDWYWQKLTDKGEEQPCGWVKDQFGLSWQVTPTVMKKMMQTKDKAQFERVLQAMFTMTKFDISKLEAAYLQP